MAKLCAQPRPAPRPRAALREPADQRVGDKLAAGDGEPGQIVDAGDRRAAIGGGDAEPGDGAVAVADRGDLAGGGAADNVHAREAPGDLPGQPVQVVAGRAEKHRQADIGLRDFRVQFAGRLGRVAGQRVARLMPSRPLVTIDALPSPLLPRLRLRRCHISGRDARRNCPRHAASRRRQCGDPGLPEAQPAIAGGRLGRQQGPQPGPAQPAGERFGQDPVDQAAAAQRHRVQPFPPGRRDRPLDNAGRQRAMEQAGPRLRRAAASGPRAAAADPAPRRPAASRPPARAARRPALPGASPLRPRRC